MARSSSQERTNQIPYDRDGKPTTQEGGSTLMAGHMKTGAPQLHQAAKDMENTNKELQTTISSVGRTIESIVESWKGVASGAFQELMNRYLQDAKTLNDSLNEIATQVSGSAAAYEQQEEESKQQLSKLSQALNNG
ncbi:WXG100 family type VII secretion target [Sciscionella sediminilitoris]|uniref:WXG100 family type VII secretion target n=1 Tax=Sciscionella sediminilitoris TaxID=1445613 RepID=UPI0009E84847